MNNSVKLSIITINFNNKLGLIKTVESVINQTYQDFEYIIIDGGSTDGSKEYIEEKQAHFDYWVSERDDGIYNAMNKGIKVAKGEYCLFLNSGDYLVRNILPSINLFSFKADIVYFDLKYQGEENEHVQVYPDNLTFKYLSTYSLPHQGSLIKRELFFKFGFYDESFKIISDWCFFLLVLAKYNASYLHVPKIFAHVDRNGISCNPKNDVIVLNERQHVLNSNFAFFVEDYEKLNDIEKKLQKITNHFFYKLFSKLKNILNLIIYKTNSVLNV